MSLKLNFLKTFTKIVEFGSFSKTAQHLDISQSAISQQIEVLENFFGVKLFERSIKGVELTEEGKILLKHVKSILGTLKIAKMEIMRSAGELRGIVRISSSTIPGEHILPKFTIKFREQYPNVTFRIEVNDSDISLMKLRNEDVDLAAVGSLDENDEFDNLVLAEEELVLAVPKDHALANREVIDLREISNYSYISRETTSGTRRESEKLMIKAGISPEDLQIVGELNTTESVLTAVSEGLGISLISTIAASKAEKTGVIKCLQLQDPVSAKRKLYLVRRKHDSVPQNQLLDEFWDFVKKRK
jgi:DNA-binding transcriptional LysR family regulator